MSVPISPVTNNQVFGTWLARTNQMSAVMTANAVTTDNTVLGGFTNGNGTVNGYFGSNTLFARDAYRGGNVTASNTMFVTANTIFQYSSDGTRNDVANLIYISSNTVSAVVTSNLYANITNITLKAIANINYLSNNYIANTTSNAFINSGNLTVNTTSNAAITSNTLYITSANAFINSNNVTITTISNAGIVSNTLTIQSANAYVNSTNIVVNTASNAYIMSANLNVNTAANTTIKTNYLTETITQNTVISGNNYSITTNNTILTGNVYINSTASYTVIKMDAPSNTVQINATSVNVASNTTFTGTNTSMISNAYVSANLTAATNTYIGDTITVGGTSGNVFLNTTSLKITNNALTGTSNLTATVTSLVYSNTLSTSTLTPASLAIGTSTSVQTTSIVTVANNTGNVQITPGTTSILATGLVNASAFTTTGNANAVNFYSGVNFISNSTNIKWTGDTSAPWLKPSISLSNTGALLIGNSVTTQTTSLLTYANSTGNVVITPTGIVVSNATSKVFEANVTSIKIDTPITLSNLNVGNDTANMSWNSTTGTLTVNGLSQFNNTVTIGDNTWASSKTGLVVYGKLTANNDLEVKGNLIISGGGISSTVSGTASIIPTTDGSYDLGATNKQWSNVYALVGIFSSNVATANLFVTQKSSFTNSAVFSNTVSVAGLLTATSGVKLKDGSVFNSVAATTGSGATVVDTFDPTVYRSAEYTISIKDTTLGGTSYQVSKILLIHNDVTPSLTEYAVMATNINPMGTFSTTITGTAPTQLVNLTFTPNPSSTITSTALKIARIALVV